MYFGDCGGRRHSFCRPFVRFQERTQRHTEGQLFAVHERFPNATQAHSRLWFFARPPYLTLSKPKMLSGTRRECFTLTVTFDFTRFFFCYNSSR